MWVRRVSIIKRANNSFICLKYDIIYLQKYKKLMQYFFLNRKLGLFIITFLWTLISRIEAVYLLFYFLLLIVHLYYILMSIFKSNNTKNEQIPTDWNHNFCEIHSCATKFYFQLISVKCLNQLFIKDLSSFIFHLYMHRNIFLGLVSYIRWYFIKFSY